MKKTVLDTYGDEVVVETPPVGSDETGVILTVTEGYERAVASLSPLDALKVARALTKVAERVLAKEVSA